MRTFKNKNGDSYRLEVNLNIRKTVLNGTDVDLFNTEPESPLWTLHEFENIDLAANILYYICLEQCTEQGVSQEDFLTALNATIVEGAVVELHKELMDFFPQRMRPVFEEVLKAVRVQIEETEAAAKRMEQSSKMAEAVKMRVRVGEQLAQKKLDKEYQKTPEQIEAELMEEVAKRRESNSSAASSPSPGS